MSDFNTCTVLDALTRRLHKAFPKSQIHPEEVSQGLRPGDFIVLLLLDEQAQVNAILNQSRPSFDVLYHPRAGRRDCMKTAGVLFDALQLIALETGELLRGSGMSCEIVDGVLHFKVTYRTHMRLAGAADPMVHLDVKMEG